MPLVWPIHPTSIGLFFSCLNCSLLICLCFKKLLSYIFLTSCLLKHFSFNQCAKTRSVCVCGLCVCVCLYRVCGLNENKKLLPNWNSNKKISFLKPSIVWTALTCMCLFLIIFLDVLFFQLLSRSYLFLSQTHPHPHPHQHPHPHRFEKRTNKGGGGGGGGGKRDGEWESSHMYSAAVWTGRAVECIKSIIWFFSAQWGIFPIYRLWCYSQNILQHAEKNRIMHKNDQWRLLNTWLKTEVCVPNLTMFNTHSDINSLAKKLC